ncbi:MAG: purine-nucleoside phosphorylase [Actinomycetia bacterium]|nr:purine-nucleoside phosphorylase [Actinomycetes bacterium]
MTDLYDRLQTAAKAIAEATGHARHDVVVVLGSASGDFPEHLQESTAIPYPQIPGFPVPAVKGHAGTLYSTTFGDNRVLLLSGRVHAYEGYNPDVLTFAVKACLAAGCHTLVVTNAAGGCGDGMTAGSIVLIADHINLAGINPLVGPNDDRLGTRFPDMSDTYTPGLRRLALEVAAEQDIALSEGVYAWFLGPTFETPAEVEMARRLGADLVGMSTVPEVICARHMGRNIIGLSVVTNLAAGIATHRLTHEDVTATANLVKEDFRRLLSGLLPRI